MRSFWTLLGVLIIGSATMSSAHAAAFHAPCEFIEMAKQELPMVMRVQSCEGTLQNRLYNAAAAVNFNNASQTQATLGMLAVESGCGTNKSNVTQASCTGVYNVKSNSSTAYGATQILSGTWQDLISQRKSWLVTQLGGCGTATKGSLLDPSITKDVYIRNQFSAFRESLCGRGSPPPTNQQYWGSQVGVSLLMAKAHDVPMQSYYNNSTVTSALTGTGVNAAGVISYAGHNLGAGGGAKFLNALAKDPNASVATAGMSECVIGCNSGLYCAKGGTSGTVKCGSASCPRCVQPVSLATAAQRMNNTMYSSSCAANGMAALQGQLNGTAGPLAVAGDGSTAPPGSFLNGTSGDEELREIMQSGGAAGTMSESACASMSGASRYQDLCNAEAVDAWEKSKAPIRKDLPEAPKGGGESNGASSYGGTGTADGAPQTSATGGLF